MGAYYIPSLHKGLVDGSAKGKLTDDYKSKCSRLEDAYIKPNRNIATRPPLKQFDKFALRTVDINDFTSNTGNYFIHGETTIDQIAADHERTDGVAPVYYSQIAKFFEELNRKNGLANQKRTLQLSIPQYNTTTGDFDTIKVRTRFTYDLSTAADCKLVNVYDENFKLLEEDSYMFCKISINYNLGDISGYGSDGTTPITTSAIEFSVTPKNSDVFGSYLPGVLRDYIEVSLVRPTSENNRVALSDYRVRNLSQLFLLFNTLDQRQNAFNPSNLYIDNIPADISALDRVYTPHGSFAPPTQLTAETPYQQQAEYCNNAGELEYVIIFKNPYKSFNPIYQGVLGLPQIDEQFQNTDINIQSNLINTLNNPGKPGTIYGAEHTNTLSLIDTLSDFYAEGANHKFVPHLSGDQSSSAFEVRERGTGFRMFGADYTMTGTSLTCDQSGSVAISSSSTEERNMQKYTEKIIDRNISNLPILAVAHPTYENRTVEDVNTEGFLSRRITLDEWNNGINRFTFAGFRSAANVASGAALAGTPVQFFDSGIIIEVNLLIYLLGGTSATTFDPIPDIDTSARNKRVFYKYEVIGYSPDGNGDGLSTPAEINLNLKRPDIGDFHYTGFSTHLVRPYYRITDVIFYTSSGVKQFKYNGPSGILPSGDNPDSVSEIQALYTEVPSTDPDYILDNSLLNFNSNFTPIFNTSFNTTRVQKNFIQEPLTLSEFVTQRPEYSRLTDRLKLAITILDQSDGASKYPGVSKYISAMPDIKITLPGSDISAEGSFLFSTSNGDNVFVGTHSPIPYKTFEGDDETKFNAGEAPIASPDSPFLKPTDRPDRKTTGAAMGNLGITLYVQSGNPVTENGIPIYCPIPAPSEPASFLGSGISTTPVNTIEVITLILDYSDPVFIDQINEMSYLSFYSSNGKEKAHIPGLIKLHNARALSSFKEELSQIYGYKAVILKTDSAVDTNTVHFILNMERDNINLQSTALKYVSNFNINIEEDNFPNNYVPINRTVASIINAIPRFEGSNSLVPWLQSSRSSLNRYLYPVQFSGFSQTTDQKTRLEKVVADIEKIKSKLLEENAPVAGKLLSLEGVDLPNPIDFHSSFNYRVAVPGTERRYTLFGPYDDNYNYFYTSQDSAIPLPSNISRIEIIKGNTRYLTNADTGELLFGSSLARRDIQEVDLDSRKITYEGIYTYKNNSAESYTNPITGETIELTRRNIGGYLQDLQEQLRNINISVEKRLLDTYFRPYSTFFKVYNSPIEVNNKISDRIVQIEDDKVYLASKEPGKENVFTLGWKEFWRNNSAVGTNPEFIRRSGISVEDDPKLARQITDPVVLGISARVGGSVELADVTETENAEILVTSQGLYRVIEGNPATLKRISRTGFTSSVVSNTSMLIGANNKVAKVVLPSEEARGYIDYIINDELTFNSDVIDVVDLAEKYKLVFFLVEHQLYVLSIGRDRKVNGFSRFNFQGDFELARIFQLDDDTIMLASTDLKDFYTLNFDKEYTDLRDDVDEGGVIRAKPYKYIIRTLPLIRLSEQSFSPNNTQVINKVIVGMTGNPVFDISVINSLRTQAFKTKAYRRNDPNNVLGEEHFSGQAVVELPSNGCELPEVEITKADGKYLEISSITFLGKV